MKKDKNKPGVTNYLTDLNRFREETLLWFKVYVKNIEGIEIGIVEL